MKKTIEATDSTPEIIIDKENQKISIKGKIIPENPIKYFAEISPIIMEFYNECDNIKLEFELEYFNTSSAKYLFDLLKKFEDKSKVEVIWIYENDDEDILEAGQDYEELTGLKFVFSCC